MRFLLIVAATALLIYAVMVGGGGIPTQPLPSAPDSVTFTGRPGPTGTDLCARLLQLHPDASCHVISQDGP